MRIFTKFLKNIRKVDVHTYSEEEFNKYATVNEDIKDNELYMRTEFIGKAILEREAREFISQKLRSDEDLTCNGIRKHACPSCSIWNSSNGWRWRAPFFK